MMSALIHLVLQEWSNFTRDLDSLGLLKPSTDRAALAQDLRGEFEQVMNKNTLRGEIDVSVLGQLLQFIL